MAIEMTGAQWIKSSYSGQGRECVEVAQLSAGYVGVRDSKNPDGPALVFTSDEWAAFTAGIQAGRLAPPM